MFKFRVGDTLYEERRPTELYEVRAIEDNGTCPWNNPWYYVKNLQSGKMYSLRKHLAEGALKVFSKIEEDDDLYI